MGPLEAAFIAKLKEKMRTWADTSVIAPSGDTRDLFEFGRRCGYYAGLQDAEAIFTSLLREENEHDN